MEREQTETSHYNAVLINGERRRGGNTVKAQSRYVAVIINSEIGDKLIYRRGAEAYRTFGLNARTGDVDELLPNAEYIPLTSEQADEYERSGLGVKKIDDALFVKVGEAVLQPRRIEPISE